MPTFKLIPCDRLTEGALNELDAMSTKIKVEAVIPPSESHPGGQLVVSYEPAKRPDKTLRAKH